LKIDNLRTEKFDYKKRVIATVTWEDTDRPAQDFFIETDNEFAPDLTCNPHSFIIPCTIAAMHHGEKRIFIDEEICPELIDGLNLAMSWLRHWRYNPDHRLVTIESRICNKDRIASMKRRAGFFFSGGIDSLATLRANRLNYPADNSGYIKDGLIVYGLEVNATEAFDYVKNDLLPIADDAKVTLVPVYTNIRYLDDDWDFWAYEFQAAALSAVAHAFVRRLSIVSIAASHNVSYLYPLGSHPLIDPNYSSNDLRIRHDGLNMSRLTKTKLVADWDIALQHIRVCTKSEDYGPDMVNCSDCEKCVRTMLALLALDKLNQTRSFTKDDLSEELVRKRIMINYPSVESSYKELIEPLMNKGRDDLIRAINYGISRYRYREPYWKTMVKQLDQKYLNRSLSKLKKIFYQLNIRTNL
jgi:hypothetical protein